MKLFGSTKDTVDTDKNSENVPKLENVEVVLVHCNYRLKQDLIKDLERYIFGEDLESIEPEEKYDESIAERVKIRKQKTFAPSSPPKKIILKKLLII